MRNIRFTHRIVVPNNSDYKKKDAGYFEELNNVTVFKLSQDDFDILRKENSLFDEFDRAFGTIIDDCEEDRIECCNISRAISITKTFMDKGEPETISGAQIVLQSLLYAKEKGVFWEIINGIEAHE